MDVIFIDVCDFLVRYARFTNKHVDVINMFLARLDNSDYFTSSGSTAYSDPIILQ